MPRLTSDISSVESSLAIFFKDCAVRYKGPWRWGGGSQLTKHDGTRTVIGIEEGDKQAVTRLKFDFGGCLERKRFLRHRSAWGQGVVPFVTLPISSFGVCTLSLPSQGRLGESLCARSISAASKAWPWSPQSSRLCSVRQHQPPHPMSRPHSRLRKLVLAVCANIRAASVRVKPCQMVSVYVAQEAGQRGVVCYSSEEVH